MTATTGQLSRWEYDHMTLRERRAYIRTGTIPGRVLARRVERAASFARRALLHQAPAAPAPVRRVTCAWCRTTDAGPGPRCTACGAPVAAS
jgi:hypothetical protein